MCYLSWGCLIWLTNSLDLQYEASFKASYAWRTSMNLFWISLVNTVLALLSGALFVLDPKNLACFFLSADTSSLSVLVCRALFCNLGCRHLKFLWVELPAFMWLTFYSTLYSVYLAILYLALQVVLGHHLVLQIIYIWHIHLYVLILLHTPNHSMFDWLNVFNKPELFSMVHTVAIMDSRNRNLNTLNSIESSSLLESILHVIQVLFG